MQIGVVYFVMATKGSSDSLPVPFLLDGWLQFQLLAIRHMQYAAPLHIHMHVHYGCGGYLTGSLSAAGAGARPAVSINRDVISNVITGWPQWWWWWCTGCDAGWMVGWILETGSLTK